MRLVRIIWNNASEQLKKLTSLPIKNFHFSKSSNSTLMSYVPPVFSTFQNTENVVKNKMVNLKQWHEEFTGLDEVRAAQDRVLDAENKFISAQETRRAINSKLSAIQNRLREIYSELDKTKRGEERYVFLITQEHSILKEERKLSEEFQTHEREEREQFSILSSALKDSHEKERLQAERTKYWSIIGSIIGTVIGVIGSSIINEMRMKELRNLVSGSVNDQLSQVLHQQKLQQKQLHTLDDLQKLLQNYNVANSNQNIDDIVDLLNQASQVEEDHLILSKQSLYIAGIVSGVLFIAFKFIS